MEKFLNLPEEKQATIIDAALAVFGTNGYKKASVSDIAAAAGISKAMIFHYFGTKKDLYLYLISYCGDLIMKEVDDKFDITLTDFFDRILLASDIKISVLRKHPATITFLTGVYFERDEEVKDDIKAVLSNYEDFRSKIAFDGMDTSRFKEGIDPQLVMKILLWMAYGFACNTNNMTGSNIEELCDEYYECMNLLKNNFYKEDYLSSKNKHNN